MVEVLSSDSTYSGDVYVEGYCSTEPRREFQVEQGAYNVDEGRCFLGITTLSDKIIEFPENCIIARAFPFVEGQVTYTNNIINENSKLKPLLITDIKAGPDIDKENLIRLHSLLLNYRDCFAFNLNEIGCINSTEMKIDLLDDKPVVYRPYRLSFSERGQVREIVNELLENDIICESNSNYASPILMVKKKTGEQRLCVDYRALNSRQSYVQMRAL